MEIMNSNCLWKEEKGYIEKDHGEKGAQEVASCI
jgi:hypothetical protein